MKRIVYFLLTNMAIMVVLGIVVHVTGANRFLTSNGLNLPTLLLFSGILGFGGAFISLWLSKTIAKFTTGAKVIATPGNATERWLVDTVQRHAQMAGIPMPEVAIYEGEPNAFATGPSRSNSLVAVSTGLLQSMTREEAEAVIAHEVSHVANGDMVTLTLIQGVVNTFVFFLARVVGYLVDSFLRRNQEESSGPGPAYLVTVLVCDIVFGILASIIVMHYSRQREYRADAGAAQLMGGPQSMIAALRRLGQMQPGALPQTVASAGINNRPAWMQWLSSHPPIEARIAALSGERMAN